MKKVLREDIKSHYQKSKNLFSLRNIVIAGTATTIATTSLLLLLNEKSPQYEAGEILLKLKPNAIIEQQNLDQGILGVPSLDELSEKYDIQWAEKIFDQADSGDISRIYQLEFDENVNIEKILKKYLKDDNVEFAEVDLMLDINSNNNIPNDPDFDEQWGPQKINGPEAWTTQTGDKNIIIAIVDTGVDYNHEDLEDKILKDSQGNIIGWNFVNNTPNPYDGNGHGTHCSGIAAASTNNNKGIAGVAWDCMIMPMKGLTDYGQGFSEDLADCIVWAADQGADVISMSWGSMMYSKTIHEAIKYANEKGVTLIAAAGNNNTRMPHYPSGLDEVVSVAATDENDEKASFSNYGATVNISAPGVDIYSTIPGNQYASFSGTSMACPHIAGVAAMILSENPNLSNEEIKNIIIKSTDKIQNTEIPKRINLSKALTYARGN